MTPYATSPVTILGTPDELNLAEVQAVLARIIAAEGPVQRHAAYGRAAQHWGIEQPDRMAERVLIKAASNLVRLGEIYVTGGDFFWPSSLQEAPVRVRTTPGAPRDAALIAPEELAAAAALVLTERGGLAPATLRGEIARLLAVEDQPGLQRGIEHLLAGGRATTVGERVWLAPPS